MLETKNRFKIYGLCWSSRSRSDALWRIYSPNSLGVRVSTTVGRVIDSIRPGKYFSEKHFFIGDVSYLPEKTNYPDRPFDFRKGKLSLKQSDFNRRITTISDAIKDMVVDKSKNIPRQPADIAKTFLVKRKAFDHESEVRFIYVDGRSSEADDGVFKIPIDPVTLISTIEFDPRMNDDVYESLRKAVLANLQGREHKIRVTKSDLYKSPEKLIYSK